MSENERARSALKHLESGCCREEWVRIGMAVKSAKLSFNDFHEWSKNGVNYKGEKDCKSVWCSFKEAGDITQATLFDYAKKNGWIDSKFNKGIELPCNNLSAKYDAKQANEKPRSDVLHVWEKCLPVSVEHEYIIQKQGKSDGLRYYPIDQQQLLICGTNVANYLVVPCWNKGIIQTLQFIAPIGGKKLNLPNASFGEGYFIVGEIKNQIYICEGISQAWAINFATGCAAVVCFGAGRMAKVAKILKTEYFGAILILVPDRGREIYVAEDAKKLGVCWVELPEDKPSNYDVSDYSKDFGSSNLGLLLSKKIKLSLRYQLLTGDELISAPPMQWIITGVIPASGLVALFGPSGSGKSFLILDMMLSISSGEPIWFGHRVVMSPVTYVCLEGEAGLGKRLKAWSVYFKKPIPSHLKFVTQPFDLLSDDVFELADAIIAAGGGGGVVVLDTLNRAAPGADENSSIDMGRIISATKKLQNILGGVIVIVHHTGKDLTRGLRGHSSLFAALDGAIEVANTPKRRGLSIAKSKDDVSGISNSFILEVVTIDIDADGNNITSCVVLSDSSSVLPERQVTLGRNQKIAMKTIDALLDGAFILNNGKCLNKAELDYEEVVTQVTEYIPADSKHRKSRARAAIAGLVDKGILGIKGDLLWKKS
ncbi:MAG: AAA family ATPase [Gammaproteobacteria bacterium]